MLVTPRVACMLSEGDSIGILVRQRNGAQPHYTYRQLT